MHNLQLPGERLAINLVLRGEVKIELSCVVGGVVHREMPEVSVDLEAVPCVPQGTVSKGVVVDALPHGLVPPVHQLPLVDVDRGLHLPPAGGPGVLPLHRCLVRPQCHVRVQLVTAEGIQGVRDPGPSGDQWIWLILASIPVATASSSDFLEAMCHLVSTLGVKCGGRNLWAAQIRILLEAAARILGLAIHLHGEHERALHTHRVTGAQPVLQVGNRLALSLELVTASLEMGGATAEPVGSRARLPVAIILISE
mmetsp:Transcript_38050/g.91283  ORF Transcript_38050/g.91283 Transcript_38050/m.91283 type:complete len:254 (-) Transcript_38050:741-1502(-)